ncbi:hypothetical protein [Ramlibacter algicola]|uniref:Uncharacterized protein n=1 Tax=Ramlibacter algicola TaxID=2795217 RepID=A0A934UTM7_9BURK|nr:hypothetical protein [Ramlibacter algicola]MBK0394687.1 hypothetical protein [Ramlibacter algicola]
MRLSCSSRFAALLLGLAALCAPLASHATAEDLRARYAQLGEQLRPDANGHTLHVDSSEEKDRLTGDVYAVLDHPFATVAASLKEPAHWCDILILPFNTKYCHAVGGGSGPVLLLRIGRKAEHPIEQTFRLRLDWRNVAATGDHFETRLLAADGPVGTRDYRITLAAIPIDGNRTFMRLTYSYAFGFTSRIAMQAYLGTAGADKVGFTVVGRDGAGRPQYIGGVRGAIERTAMRYYLAIDAFLESLAAAPGQQAERRIQAWFTSTEKYARQLHEMDRQQYVAMKRQEVVRQQAIIE